METYWELDDHQFEEQTADDMVGFGLHFSTDDELVRELELRADRGRYFDPYMIRRLLRVVAKCRG